jgi:hypothetical protein
MDDQQPVVPVSRLLDERGLGSFQIVRQRRSKALA